MLVRRPLVVLILLLLAGCVGHAGAPADTVEATTVSGLDSVTVEELAAEFRSLRAIAGHFAGGQWNDDIDRWMGRKHQLMIELGSRLGADRHSRAELVRLLDPPDRVASEGDELFDLIGSLPQFEGPAGNSYEFLVYYWRGTHDFLYFICQEDVVIGAGWWYAGE